MKKDKIKDDILRVWDHAGLDAEMDARQLAKTLGKDPDLKKAGSRSGRQLQHAQVGEAFGREGVLGAMSNNIKSISVKDIASKNNVAAKKISAGLITRIVFSLIGNNSSNALYFPVMWKPIINYFLGKLFGDKKITKEEYEKGIKGTLINEGYEMVLDKQLILEGFARQLATGALSGIGGAALGGAATLAAGEFGMLPGTISTGDMIDIQKDQGIVPSLIAKGNSLHNTINMAPVGAALGGLAGTVVAYKKAR